MMLIGNIEQDAGFLFYKFSLCSCVVMFVRANGYQCVGFWEMDGVESFDSLCLHHLSELYDHLDFIAYIFHLILYLGQVCSYLMSILIISFTDLSKREEREKCNK